MFKQSVFALCAVLLGAFPALASEANVRKAFEARFPSMKIESITRMPFPGLYEVVFDGQVVYTDEKLTYLMSGNLFDLRSSQERNLTRERRDQIASGALVKAQGNAIKRVKGNGKRVVYTFEDPNCGYCKELQKEFNKMTDITVYTFLLPILSPDSAEKSKAVWCAKDRGKAWDDLMNKAALPANAVKTCATPLEENQQLAQRFGVRGTPAVFLANGQQVGGYLPAEKLEQAFGSVR
ncbi:MAG: DsbC family protein [Burkholderiales bacterium]|jgi:thiol:disulfide interchange protein DsbC|nr:DsbC family protein [Burkholderiales bacterium]